MSKLIDRLVPKHICDLHPYEPGKPLKDVQRELGIKNLVKLASNENPLGASPKGMAAVRKAVSRVSFYPEDGFDLLNTISKTLKVDPAEVVFGSGSNEVIELLMRCLLGKGDNIVVSRYAFVVYKLIAQGIGAKTREAKPDGFGHNLDEMSKLVNDRTKIIFIANPNNPTGTYVKEPELVKFLNRHKDKLVVMDEAYYEYVEAKDYPQTLELRKRFKNLVVMRTFSKAYGLAGLRIGYGIGDKKLIGYLNALRQPFNVNMMAQVAAEAALRDKEFIKASRKLNSEGKKQLYAGLEKMGLEYHPTEANFILIKTGNGRKMFNDLQKEGVIARALDVYGLPEYIRVTIGKPAQNRKFLSALKKLTAC